ncbi:MAG TPA: hypothetical protein PLG23_01330 [Thermoflexales bacterium]|jgi:hypothetical protein|nr:hypothetical protein [Thermoflexales bacterium]HQX09048.1 hypothetical protein [Thermoflexales bacterium]HQY25366.1 hypothetical protein [Thermoflexales bacterium]HQZ52070.1 hypothetical protein [Thermoflexales bacterium]HRA55220.1 hypothetical protein [Thermoflexales bacterium]
MTTPINLTIEQLRKCHPLNAGRFAEILGAPLVPGAANAHWLFFTFELEQGDFAGGELRLSVTGERALLNLKPRNPPGLKSSDIDLLDLGQRRGFKPNPDIPPEGADTEYFNKGGVEIGLQWTHTSRQLRSVVLKWEPSQPNE